MPSLLISSPHRGLKYFTDHLFYEVLPLYQSAGVFQRIDLDPSKGVSYSHSITLIDINDPTAPPPPEGVNCRWYFAYTPSLSACAYQHLDPPVFGVASSGMIVGSLIQSLPPNPPPRVFSRVTNLRSLPPVTVLPQVQRFSERQLGISLEQLRLKTLGKATADAFILLVSDGWNVLAHRNQLETSITVEFIHRILKKLPKAVIGVQQPGPKIEDHLLGLNDIPEGSVIRCSEDTPPYLFDIAVGLSPTCYWPLQLSKAAVAGIPTVTTGSHTWMEAVTHLNTVPVSPTHVSLIGDELLAHPDVNGLVDATVANLFKSVAPLTFHNNELGQKTYHAFLRLNGLDV